MAFPYFLPVAASILVGCLLTLPWERQALKGYLSRDLTRLPEWEYLETDTFTRQVHTFLSQGTKCEGWLYLPKIVGSGAGDARAPVVVMAHGLGVQKDMGLQRYAAAFAAAGYAVMLFDYRHFGGSDGEPRHLVNAGKQLEDWHAAIKYVQGLSAAGVQVDSSRLGLWGVSFSGGHALTAAASLGASISAVVANEPFLASGLVVLHELKMRGPLQLVRAAVVAVSDALRGLLGMPPAYLRLIGRRGQVAMLVLSDAEYEASGVGVASTHFHQGGWQNYITGRTMLQVLQYQPLRHVSRIQAPVLLRAATQDDLCSIDTIRQAAALLGGRATLLERDVGHLEAHRHGHEPQELQPVLDFLARHLAGGAAAGAASQAAAAAVLQEPDDVLLL